MKNLCLADLGCASFPEHPTAAASCDTRRSEVLTILRDWQVWDAERAVWHESVLCVGVKIRKIWCLCHTFSDDRHFIE